MSLFLIVDDNADSADMMARILRYYQFAYDIVSSAEEALHQVQERAYTGMIIDLALPLMDGWTLLRHLRATPHTQDLACIAVTAYHASELPFKAHDAGFTAYFAKPLEKQAFAAELQRIAG